MIAVRTYGDGVARWRSLTPGRQCRRVRHVPSGTTG